MHMEPYVAFHRLTSEWLDSHQRRKCLPLVGYFPDKKGFVEHDSSYTCYIHWRNRCLWVVSLCSEAPFTHRERSTELSWIPPNVTMRHESQ
jgi:hypothetical protein